MSEIDRLVENARAYATRYPRDHRPVQPRLHVAVVACMDSRMDLFGLLGLDVGDAHVLRNAGGVVTADTIRSLALSQRLLGTREVILIHHTDCGMQKVTEDEFKLELQRETGVKPDWALENFVDIEADVRQSIARVRANPFVPHTDVVRGFVFDVDSGELREIPA